MKVVKREQTIDRKLEIYSKALDLFIKNGYDNTSMDMIARVLGVSKPTLYYYCSSKEDLLYEIYVDDMRRGFIGILEEAEQITDPKQRIVFFLRKFTLMCASNRATGVLVRELHNLNRIHRNEIILVWKRAYDLIRGTIVELQQLGRVRKFRESFLTFLGTGMAFWTMYWWDYGRQVNVEELSETVVEVFLNGAFIKKGKIDSI